MEVFQHCMREAFHSSDIGSELLEEEINVLELHHRRCSVSKMMTFFDNITYVNTSTPNTSRTSGSTSCDDSGFNDSFSSDSAASQLSSLYLNDSAHDECRGVKDESLPMMCLLSKFDESDDELDGSLCELLNSDVPLEIKLNLAKVAADCLPEISSASGCTNLPLPSVTNLEQSGAERSSSTRRLRSPTPMVHRRLRHRLSLDSYTESHLEETRSQRRLSESLPMQLVDSLIDECAADCKSSIEGVAVDRTRHVDSMIQLTLLQFAPTYLDRLIGRKMGLDSVDIIAELASRSMAVIIGKILNYVAASDLCRYKFLFMLPKPLMHCRLAVTLILHFVI